MTVKRKASHREGLLETICLLSALREAEGEDDELDASDAASPFLGDTFVHIHLHRRWKNRNEEQSRSIGYPAVR